MTQPTGSQSQPTPSPDTVQTMFHMIMDFRVSQMIHVAAKLAVADLLTSGPQTATDLALATSTHAPSLYRLLRALASLGIFAEDDQGRFTLTPLAALLQSGVPGSMRSRTLFYADPQQWHTWSELLYSITTGEPAFQHLYGTDAWTYRSQNPEANNLFNAFMTENTGLFVNAIVAAYDFTGINTLVDVAGGQGLLISAILAANPHLNGILCDVPNVISTARPLLEAAGVLDRCALTSCDFFASVPQGGDAYILKSIVHDWDDAHASAILSTCRRATPPHGRLLLVENVIKSGNDPDRAKLLDLEMLLQLGGRERTESDYRQLLSGAGFHLTKITHTQAQFSIIEATPV